MVWVDEADLPLLAERSVSIAHNPSSNLRLRSGVAPIANMNKAGIRLGIGLDGHTLDEDQNYLREMRLAWTLSNRPGAESPTVSPEAIFHMGTVSGAEATFGTGTPLGQLAPDYLADVVLLDWAGVRGAWSPDGYPIPEQAIPFLLRKANRQHIRHVMLNGQWVVHDGRSTTLDEGAIALAIREQLAAQMNQPGQTEVIRKLLPHLRRFYALWDDREQML
jgi:cytosine/adenosine deaminase-related metal-dependent hydrolase